MYPQLQQPRPTPSPPIQKVRSYPQASVDTVDNVRKSLILLTFCKCVRLSSAVALNTRFIMLSLLLLVHRISTGRLDRIELCTGFCGWILASGRLACG